MLVIVYEGVILFLLLGTLFKTEDADAGWSFDLNYINVDNKAIFLALSMFVPIAFRHIFPFIENIKLGNAEVSFRNRLNQMEYKVQEMDGTIKEVEKQAVISAHKHEAAFFAIATSLSRELLVDKRRPTGRSLKDIALLLGQMDFTESWILTRIFQKTLMSLSAAHGNPFEVADKVYPGEPTLMTFFRLLTGKIDMFIWYSGTGMKLADGSFDDVDIDDEKAVREALNEVYQPLQLTWLPSLGFEDSESLVMLRKTAEELHIKDMTGLKEQAFKLKFGANREFFLRDWYYPSLVRKGVKFRDTTDEVSINDRLSGMFRGEFDVGVCMATSPYYNDPRVKVIEPSDVFPRLPQYVMPIFRSDIYEELKEFDIDKALPHLLKEDMEAFLFQAEQYHIVNNEDPGLDGLVDEYLEDRDRWRKKYSRHG